MHAHQTNTFATFWNPLQALAVILNQGRKMLTDSREASDIEQDLSDVPVDLRRDIGVIDGRLSRQQSLTGAIRPRQTTLEANWLRQFR